MQPCEDRQSTASNSETSVTVLPKPVFPKRLCRRRLAAVLIVVSLAAGFVGGLFGFLAGLGYGLSFYLGGGDSTSIGYSKFIERLGLGVGAAVGAMAGVAWCWQMTRRASEDRLARPLQTSAWLGFQAGWAATILLQAVLWWADNEVNPALLAIGLVCGSVAGPVLGCMMSGVIPWVFVQVDTATESNR